ncbi:MAG: inositol monophosphatase family protein [Bacteroidota bacterium]
MIKIAIEAALEAGAYLKDNVGKIHQIEQKEGQATNLVTEIDKNSEKLIIKKLSRHFPDHDFLGEESGSRAVKSEYRWIIDPLDGTVNYTHALPIFCVSIGLEYRGEIIAGVVYDPSANELFTAEKGKGAFLNGSRITVSKTSELIKSMLVTGFPYNIADNLSLYLNSFKVFLSEAQAVRRLGSAALDLSYVACGRFDGFWEGALHAWDMAAGVLLVIEAGGRWTDYAGHQVTVYNPQLLATNGLIHAPMMDVLKRNIK